MRGVNTEQFPLLTGSLGHPGRKAESLGATAATFPVNVSSLDPVNPLTNVFIYIYFFTKLTVLLCFLRQKACLRLIHKAHQSCVYKKNDAMLP